MPALSDTQTDNAENFAYAFVPRLLGIDFAHQTRQELAEWTQAEAAASMLPGLPAAAADNTLYASLFVPGLPGGGPSPMPSAAQWAADAKAGVVWHVVSMTASEDPQWAQAIAAGYQSAGPVDDRPRRVGRPGRHGPAVTRPDRHFTFQLLVGSALHHPNYGAGEVLATGRPARCRAAGATRWAASASAVGGAAKAAAGDAFSEIANDFAHTAQHATAWLWGQLDQATALRIGGAGWGTYLGITVTLAVAIGAGLFLIQVIASALRRDMGGMGRALRGLLVAFVAGGAAVGVTEILLQAADAISNGIMQVGLGTSDWQSVGNKFATLSATQYGPATLLLAALFTCAATVLVWLALMVRKVLLILTAVFAPVAFAGSLSDITAGWVRKWIEYTVALIASKIVLVIVFVVGLGVLMNNLGSTGNSSTQQLTQLMAGLLILTVAGLAPWMAVKFVHFTGEAFHTIHSHSGAATGAAAGAVAAPQKIRNTATSFGIKGSGGQGRPYTARWERGRRHGRQSRWPRCRWRRWLALALPPGLRLRAPRRRRTRLSAR